MSISWFNDQIISIHTIDKFQSFFYFSSWNLNQFNDRDLIHFKFFSEFSLPKFSIRQRIFYRNGLNHRNKNKFLQHITEKSKSLVAWVCRIYLCWENYGFREHQRNDSMSSRELFYWWNNDPIKLLNNWV